MDRRTDLYTEGGWLVIRKGELISMEEARPCRTISTSPAQHINIDKSHTEIPALEIENLSWKMVWFSRAVENEKGMEGLKENWEKIDFSLRFYYFNFKSSLGFSPKMKDLPWGFLISQKIIKDLHHTIIVSLKGF